MRAFISQSLTVCVAPQSCRLFPLRVWKTFASLSQRVVNGWLWQLSRLSLYVRCCSSKGLQCKNSLVWAFIKKKIEWLKLCRSEWNLQCGNWLDKHNFFTVDFGHLKVDVALVSSEHLKVFCDLRSRHPIGRHSLHDKETMLSNLAPGAHCLIRAKSSHHVRQSFFFFFFKCLFIITFLYKETRLKGETKTCQCKNILPSTLFTSLWRNPCSCQIVKL